MAPSQVIDDYYQILDVPQSAGRDAIRTNYKKLAFKYHPDRNPHNPQATAQFQLLEAAYSTLFDPERRRIYDLQYDFIKLQHPTSPYAKKNNPPSPTSPQESETSKYYELRIEQVGAALEELRKEKAALENELLNAQRECCNSQSALDKLRADESRDLNMQYEIDSSGWFGYFFSAREPKEEKLARQRRMDSYEADLRLRWAEFRRHANRINAANSSLRALNEHIKNRMLEKRILQREAAQIADAERQAAALMAEIQLREAARMAEIQRREAAQMAKAQRREAARMANNRRQQAMREEREAKAREEAERVRREQQAERERKEQEAERVRREQQAERERKEQEVETMPRAQEVRNAIEELLRKHREEMRDKGLNTVKKAKTGRKGHKERRGPTKKN